MNPDDFLNPAAMSKLVLAFGGKELLVKLLGPTFEYLGGEVRDFTKKRWENIWRPIAAAGRKLGSELSQEGCVPPRVFKAVVDAAEFNEDALMAEYLGGVLASSRTGVSRDDRGVTVVSLLARLSSYQIRAHYIFYSVMKQLYKAPGASWDPWDRSEVFTIYMPMSVFAAAMDFGDQENQEQLVHHILTGLSREQLIDPVQKFGEPSRLQEEFGLPFRFPERGIILQPNSVGTELFLWAHGRRDLSPGSLFEADLEFPPLEGIQIPSGSVAFKWKPPKDHLVWV